MDPKRALTFLSAFILSGCATIRNEIVYQTENLEVYQSSARSMGLVMERTDYLAALERWPWVRGAQLHRRALLLRVGLLPPALQKLDQSSDVGLELKLLEKLENTKPASTKVGAL